MILQEIKMNSEEFIPMEDYILIKPDEVKTSVETEGGIIIHEQKSIRHRPCSGTVISKSPNVGNFNYGDYVVFPDTDGIDVKFLDSNENIEQPQFLLLRVKSIIGKKRV